MNSIENLFQHKKERVLNVYFTAGYPDLNSTQTILKELDASSTDLIEIGFPYSDPIADGATIQESGSIALKNGITIQTIFDQVATVKDSISTPLIAMGYYNQFLQFGEEKFLKECVRSGISGVIFPDLPLEIYQAQYAELFEKYNIAFTFLITPQTSDERIHQLAASSKGYLYVVSSTSTTGKNNDVSETQKNYFQRIKELKLEIPYLIGFGIHNKETFDIASDYSNGAIIGSSFIKNIDKNNITDSIQTYISKIKQ